MREYVVELSGAVTYEEAVAAFNEGFCRRCGGEWDGRSWNAFHDYLSWPGEGRFRLVLRGWAGCRGLEPGDRDTITAILRDNDHVEARYE